MQSNPPNRGNNNKLAEEPAPVEGKKPLEQNEDMYEGFVLIPNDAPEANPLDEADFIELKLQKEGVAEKLPTLSKPELEYLINEANKNPERKLFPANVTLKHKVFKFDNNQFVVCGKGLGSGFWGKAKIGMLYTVNPQDVNSEIVPVKCVIKLPKASSIIGPYVNKAFNLNQKMIAEGNLNKEVHGMGESITFTSTRGKVKAAILLPFLGKISLAGMLKRADIIQTLSVTNWIKLFINLCIKLDVIHEKKQIHNDIKPDNVGVTLIETNHGYDLKQVEFYDLGNALPKNSRGWGGDPVYQPKEALLPFVKKNVEVDIAALGKTFNTALIAIDKYHSNAIERQALAACKELVKQMTDFVPKNRPSIKDVALALDKAYKAMPEQSIKMETVSIVSSNVRQTP